MSKAHVLDHTFSQGTGDNLKRKYLEGMKITHVLVITKHWYG